MISVSYLFEFSQDVTKPAMLQQKSGQLPLNQSLVELILMKDLKSLRKRVSINT